MWVVHKPYSAPEQRTQSQRLQLCTTVSKFSVFPNHGRWDVLVRMTWVVFPWDYCNREDVLLEEEKGTGRGSEIVLCLLPSSGGIQKSLS